ncbi:MAG: hypothetical protein GY765_35740 [bacterium]|nr:hypothetical protein [bacterium]
MSEYNNVGGWTPYSNEISPEVMSLFEKTIKALVGVKYTPFAVASQSMDGTNYSFFCNAKPTYGGALDKGALVQLKQPLEGIPHIVSIRMLNQ